MLLDKVIAAKGGLATLRGLKTITAVTAETVQAPAGPLEAQTTTFLQYPDHVRIERKLPEGVGVQVFDGEHGWIKDPRGVRAVTDLAIRQMQTTLERDTVTALLAAHDGRLRARLLPDVKDESGTVRHALELSANTVEPFVLYIDPATNLIDKEAYVSGEPGQPLVEEIYSDYRPVDGVQISFSGPMRRAGQRLVTRRVTAFTINTLLDPSLFKRPGS